MALNHAWESVYTYREPFPCVRRFSVPGGWLYQVEVVYGSARSWHPPVFVPDGAKEAK